MRVSLVEIGQDDVLAGAINGVTALSRLVAAVRGLTAPTVVALDFAGVTVATGSFLRECILGFKAYCRRSQANLYPVAADMNDTVLEEFRDLLQARREAAVCCVLGPGGEPERPWVEGVLEEKQLVTLDAVLASGETDAGALADRFAGIEKISTTGWNNRLASLADEGILVEARVGRVKRYRPVLRIWSRITSRDQGD